MISVQTTKQGTEVYVRKVNIWTRRGKKKTYFFRSFANVSQTPLAVTKKMGQKSAADTAI